MKRIVLCLFSFLLLASSVHAATVTDGNFTDWTFTTSVWGGAALQDNGFASIVDDSGEIMVNIETITYTTGKSVFVLGVKNDFTWNPLTDGAIDSISMALDHRLVSYTSGSSYNHGLSIVIFQGGNFYYRGLSEYAGGNYTWDTIDSATLPEGPLSQDDFYLLTPNVGVTDSAHPDFSASGAPILFGFSANAHISRELIHDYDNFELTINPVPVPGAFLLFASGLAGLVGLRRKQHR